jgi:hypothetical protein
MSQLVAQIGALTPQAWGRAEKIRFESEATALIEAALAEAHVKGRAEMYAEVCERARHFSGWKLEIDRAQEMADRSRSMRVTYEIGQVLSRILGPHA